MRKQLWGVVALTVTLASACSETPGPVAPRANLVGGIRADVMPVTGTGGLSINAVFQNAVYVGGESPFSVTLENADLSHAFRVSWDGTYCAPGQPNTGTLTRFSEVIGNPAAGGNGNASSVFFWEVPYCNSNVAVNVAVVDLSINNVVGYQRVYIRGATYHQ